MSKKNGILFGRRTVNAFVSRFPERLLSLEVAQGESEKNLSALVDQVRQLGVTVNTLPQKTLDGMAEGGRHQGVCARIRYAPELSEHDLPELLTDVSLPLLLVLDRIQDPHNLGACLRTAEAAGVHAVVAPRNQAVGLTPAVRKVASGAAEYVPFIRVANLARSLREIQAMGIWCLGFDGEAQDSFFDTDATLPIALVLGSEGEGLKQLTRKTCDHLVNLPMLGEIESLNVSVAAGISLYEVMRQRLKT